MSVGVTACRLVGEAATGEEVVAVSGARALTAGLVALVVVGAVATITMLLVLDGPATVSLAESKAWLEEPDLVVITVPSCHGDPVLEVLEEVGNEVRLQAATTSGSMDDCLDVVRAHLQADLGDRWLVDLASGARLLVHRP